MSQTIATSRLRKETSKRTITPSAPGIAFTPSDLPLAVGLACPVRVAVIEAYYGQVSHNEFEFMVFSLSNDL